MMNLCREKVNPCSSVLFTIGLLNYMFLYFKFGTIMLIIRHKEQYIIDVLYSAVSEGENSNSKYPQSKPMFFNLFFNFIIF